MLEKTGLVLEGGSTRGVFTAGVLDCLMDRKIKFPYIIGVSAGACNGIDYVSWQRGRTKDCMIPSRGNGYVSLKTILKKKSLYDMDMIFWKYPEEIYPFDYETFFQSEMEFEMVVTNCITGAPEYKSERKDKVRLMQICRASCSMPFAAPMVEIDGVPYLDGGVADSVPLERAQEKGYEKNVIVLTRKKGYRKPPLSRKMKTLERIYKDYPNLIDAMNQRHEVYNEVMEKIEDLEERGQVFVLRPEGKLVSRTETNQDALLTLYHHGYRVMMRQMEELAAFLNC